MNQNRTSNNDFNTQIYLIGLLILESFTAIWAVNILLNVSIIQSIPLFVIFLLTLGAHYLYHFYFKRNVSLQELEISETGQVHLATVEALATAIDARDQLAQGHIRRVQIYAIGMGEALELSQENVLALKNGALLHDIGKLAVPDHILNKPGKLTAAEMEKMKVHASVGAGILEHINFPYPVVETVKHHHEAWDGSGYPDGLEGEKIPLTARILAIVDTYDALRESHSYQDAMSRERARKVILSGAGSKFDSHLVDTFLRNLRNFETEIDAQGLGYSRNVEEAQNLNSIAGDFADLQRITSTTSYVDQIKKANREVFTLYELARVFGSSLKLQDTLDLFTTKISEFVPFDTCAVYLYDEELGVARAAHVVGRHASELVNRSVKMGEGATGYVLSTQENVYTINPALDFSFFKASFVEEYKSMASLPLIANDKLVGAISLYSCALESYEDEHIRLIETISRIAADAISKAVYHAETESRALTDPMTNLPNARSLQIHFDKESARARRTGNLLQVIMIDLDGFKNVNDTFGHKAGDHLLREVSRVMKSQLRDYDFLSRYAGDEFVAIVPDLDDAEVTELCSRIEEAVSRFELPVGLDEVARVGVSLGFASFPENGDTLDKAIAAADKMMYLVKATHKSVKMPVVPVLPSFLEPTSFAPVLSETAYYPKLDLTEAEIVPEVSPEVIDIDHMEMNQMVMELDESHIISKVLN